MQTARNLNIKPVDLLLFNRHTITVCICFVLFDQLTAQYKQLPKYTHSMHCAAQQYYIETYCKPTG